MPRAILLRETAVLLLRPMKWEIPDWPSSGDYEVHGIQGDRPEKKVLTRRAKLIAIRGRWSPAYCIDNLLLWSDAYVNSWVVGWRESGSGSNEYDHKQSHTLCVNAIPLSLYKNNICSICWTTSSDY